MRRLFIGLAIASIAALSPCWVHADDQHIAQQIVQQLQQQKADGKLNGFGIDLEVESGIVWLKGHVRSSEQQTLVLDIARRINGVEQVVNDLHVKAAPAPAMAKAPTPGPAWKPPTARVQTALLRTEAGAGELLKKSTGLLTNLRGNVQRALGLQADDEREEEKDVEQVAKPEPPTQVARRASKPTPEPTPAPAPQPKAQLAVAQQPQPAARQPQPVAQQPQLAARQSQPVAQQPQLAVEQPRRAAVTDNQLAEAVIDRLRTQKERGTLQDFDIDVQVDEQVVWISGRVASETQRNLVLDVSRRVRGVKQVVNDLQIDEPAPIQVASVPVPTSAPELAPVTKEPEVPEASTETPAAQTAAATVPATAATPAPAPFNYVPRQVAARVPASSQVPLAFAPAQSVAYNQQMMAQPVPEVPAAAGVARARFDHPSMPGYAWPSYAAYPNYGAVTYPRQYSPTAWPYIGPFYPYPQVPLGWRKVTLEWDDGWWMLDFKSK